MHHITSIQNPRIKRVAKLRRRRERNQQGRFLIDGRREIVRAIEANVDIDEAYVCDSSSNSRHPDEPENDVVASLEQRGVVVSLVSRQVFEKLCFGERTDDGLVVVAKTPVRSLDDMQLPDCPLIAVIEGLEKPGNVGAVLRSADGAGVDAVVVADPLTDLFNPNAIRSSLGTVFAKSVCPASSSDTLQWLRQRGVAIFAARPDAQQDYTQVDLQHPAAIVLGSEADGLSDVWSQDDVRPVRLPMRGIADSLNVSAAAAVLFYEARRQRDQVDQ